MSIFIRALLADGHVFEGPIQGNGGKLGDGTAYLGAERATGAAIDQIRQVQRLHANGRPTGVYEPQPGHVALYPDWNGWGDGPPVAVPLSGTTFEVPPKRWNPRYLAYAKAYGETDPETMMERDRARYPGGHMCGFMLWMSARWSEWRELKGYDMYRPLGPADHAEFDTWLQETVNERFAQ